MRLIFVIILLMFVFDVVWWLLADSRLRKLPRPRLARILVAVFALAQLAGLAWMLSSRIVRDRGWDLPQSYAAAMYLWHFIILPATVVLFGGFGIVKSIATGVDRLRTALHANPDATETPTPSSDSPVGVSPVRVSPIGAVSLSRREMLGVAVAAVPPLVCGAATVRSMSTAGDFRINRITLPLRGLPAELDGFTIAHVSDTHVGSFTNGKVLDAIVEQTNRLKSDVVVLTGDLINHRIVDLPAAISMVERMRGGLGVYLCEGNHDLMQGREAFESRVRAAGLKLLVNESDVVSVGKQEIQFLGLRWGGRLPFATRVTDPKNRAVTGPVQTVAPQLRPGAFPILLAHHPHAFDSAADAGIPLTLAGHTHGGQLMATRDVGFGPMMFRYWSGVYRQSMNDGNDAALVVSNGTGNWFPLRVNAPAEIVHVTLTRA